MMRCFRKEASTCVGAFIAIAWCVQSNRHMQASVLIPCSQASIAGDTATYEEPSASSGIESVTQTRHSEEAPAFTEASARSEASALTKASVLTKASALMEASALTKVFALTKASEAGVPTSNAIVHTNGASCPEAFIRTEGAANWVCPIIRACRLKTRVVSAI